MASKKERQQQLANDLSKSTIYEVQAARELLQIQLDSIKDKAVSHQPVEDMYRLQGEAAAIQRLQSLFTRVAPTTTE